MKKYAILVIAILAVVVFASGCTSDGNSTKTYDEDGISFNYPDNWEQLSNVTNAQNVVVGFGDPDTLDSSTNIVTTLVAVQKISLPSGYTLKKAHDEAYAQLAAGDSSFQKISNKTITVNGLTGYEDTYKENVNGVQKQEVSAWFEKNGNIYGITCSALPKDFNNQQATFNAIINSFKIQ